VAVNVCVTASGDAISARRTYHEIVILVSPWLRKACTASFMGASGVCHSVEVAVDSLYQAAIFGFSLLK